MFGPNKSDNISELVNFHHREENFFSILRDLKQLIREKFDIDNNSEIVIINGSGTLTMELIIASFTSSFFTSGVKGKFIDRWSDMLLLYKKRSKNGKKLHVQYETSISTHNKMKDNESFFVDGISSFPYYSMPKNSNIFVTVSSKILGASPVLGIIIVKKDILNNFISYNEETYLNLNRWIKYSETNQTPFTPSISLYMDLLKKVYLLNIKEIKDKINYVSDQLIGLFGAENILGDLRGPAITFKNKNLISKKIRDRYKIYGTQNLDSNSKMQIFTYSEEIREYEKLFKDLRK
jgi:hypothetical protein